VPQTLRSPHDTLAPLAQLAEQLTLKTKWGIFKTPRNVQKTLL